MAKIHYEADGAISPALFIAALTDFSDRRPELWPNLDAKYYELHELGDTWAEVTEGTDLLGGVWARERYDWSEPGHVQPPARRRGRLPAGHDDRLRGLSTRRRRLSRGRRLPADRRQPAWQARGHPRPGPR